MLSESVTRPGNSRPTILVVDDFDDTRWLLRTWLERKGFRVIEAENGNDAISEAQSENPDLIIMDLEMPELDGLAATRQIRASENLADVPIVVVSANSISRNFSRSRGWQRIEIRLPGRFFFICVCVR